jgi:hypothetical protein
MICPLARGRQWSDEVSKLSRLNGPGFRFIRDLPFMEDSPHRHLEK